MSDQEKLIASLESKGLLDEPSIERLRGRLKRKLQREADEQKKEMSILKSELFILQKVIPL